MSGLCRYCSCRDETPCEGGCAWVDADQTLCSVCFAAAEIAEHVVTVLGRVLTMKQHLKQTGSVAVSWDELEVKDRRLLVMACRATVEAIREGLAVAIGADAVAATVELTTITDFLLDTCPEQVDLAADESVSAIVMRLLEPHVGHRIVVP
jgi:uncharacterized protein with PhoU and TrkA domain